jgi:hypothetical protein
VGSGVSGTEETETEAEDGAGDSAAAASSPFSASFFARSSISLVISVSCEKCTEERTGERQANTLIVVPLYLLVRCDIRCFCAD